MGIFSFHNKMFRLMLALGLYLSLGLTPLSLCYSESASGLEPLDGLETQYFGRIFGEDPLDVRLARLEQLLYGDVVSGAPDVRLQSLIKGVSKYQPSSSNTAPEAPQAPVAPSAPVSPKSQAPDVTDYPSVTRLEEKFLGKTFTQDPLENRLGRLEAKVFGQATPQAALSDRVERLQVQGGGGLETPPLASPGAGSVDWDLYKKIEAMEIRVFGRMASGKLMNERIDALEQSTYGRTLGNDSPEVRVNRLLGHFNQNSPGQTPSGLSGYTAGYGSSSTSRGYTPRPIIQSRPPVMRQPNYGGAVQGGGIGNGGYGPQYGYSIQGGGTVIIPQSSGDDEDGSPFHPFGRGTSGGSAPFTSPQNSQPQFAQPQYGMPQYRAPQQNGQYGT